MSERISSSDARLRFAELLERVGQGESFIVELHGKGIAILAPFQAKTLKPGKKTPLKSEEAMTVKDYLHAQINAKVGLPVTQTNYVSRWRLGDMDIVAERRGNKGKAWVPYNSRFMRLQSATERKPGDNVNNNVYSKTPSMRSRHLIQFDMDATDAVDELLTVLMGRKRGS